MDIEVKIGWQDVKPGQVVIEQSKYGDDQLEVPIEVNCDMTVRISAISSAHRGQGEGSHLWAELFLDNAIVANGETHHFHTAETTMAAVLKLKRGVRHKIRIDQRNENAWVLANYLKVTVFSIP